MLEQKVTLVVGGHSSVARQLYVELGHTRTFVALSRHSEPLENVNLIQADAVDAQQMQEAVAQVLEKFGRIDEYIHLVGSILIKPLHQTTVSQWHDVLNVNLNSIYYGLHAVLPAMMRQKQGNIVLVSSVAALLGLANHEAIAAAKGAVASLVPTLASTYALSNIRVNGLAPTLVNSQMAQSLVQNELAMKATVEMIPLRRIATPKDVAGAIAFLCSDSATFINGQVLPVDGGMVSVRRPPRISV